MAPCYPHAAVIFYIKIKLIKMLVVISPAKKLDMSQKEFSDVSKPLFVDQTSELVGVMQSLDADRLKKLMSISDNLAALNADRFLRFGMQERKPAIFAFAGDTYHGLDADTLDNEDLVWAQNHLRIISGLYGLLRPLDEIEPYRLEMGSRLATKRGRSLYDFWGSQLANALNEVATQTGAEMLVNCASKEYFSAIDVACLKFPVLTPIFLEHNDGKPKIVSFYAKKARGAMARFVMQNKLKTRQELEEFSAGGYQYQPDLSDGTSLIFVR